MKKFRYNDESLKKVYEDEGKKLKMTYGDFKKWAEHFANTLINKAKKEVNDEKTIEQ